MVKFVRPPGHRCKVSTGIHEGLTFGTGKLDEQQFPEDGFCWPFTDSQLVQMGLKGV